MKSTRTPDMDASERLDLTFIATGAWQHVFVKTGQKEDGWVYKIPSAFGYFLPLDHPQRPRSKELYTRISSILLTNLPLGNRLFASHLKRVSRKKFDSMLGIIEKIAAHGLSDILLPCEVRRNQEAMLRVNAASVAYRGPILTQKRADYVFARSEPLRSLGWQEFIEAHHRFWRCGITFRNVTGILSLKNWGLLDGRLRLVDTSSLTRDRRRAWRVLSRKELDRMEENGLKRLSKCDASEPVEEYFCFIRRELNRDKLKQLWELDINGGADTGSPHECCQ